MPAFQCNLFQTSNIFILCCYAVILIQYYIQKVVSEPLERISRCETSNIAENKVFTDFERVICNGNNKMPKF